MTKGFSTILSAQFFSALADNALTIILIEYLMMIDSPEWTTPLIKLFFFFSYVLLAPFVGSFADRIHKGHVMFFSNTLKCLGCLVIFILSCFPHTSLTWLFTLFCSLFIGFGAAMYSPAKYGILIELLESRLLVIANAWLETLTVLSVILGAVLSGILINDTARGVVFGYFPALAQWAIQIPLLFMIALYILSGIITLFIPKTGVTYPKTPINMPFLLKEFIYCFRTLWSDKLGQLALGATTLLWGAGAVLQFIILKWATEFLHMSFSQSAMFQGLSGVGLIIGAAIASKGVPLQKTIHMLPIGLVITFLLPSINFIHSLIPAIIMMILISALSGFIVVTMNALIQHRGYCLMGAGRSVAVQNFTEHGSILVMMLIYALLILKKVDTRHIVWTFSAIFFAVFFGLWLRYLLLKKRHPLESYLDLKKPT